MAIAFKGNRDAAVATGYTPAPDGDYFITVVDAEEKKAKSGRDMLELEFVIAMGPFENKHVWHYLTFIEEGAKGHGFTLTALKAFGFAGDGEISLSAADFKGRTVKAKLGVESYEGKEKNIVKEFYVLDDEQMAADARTVMGEEPEAPAPAPAKPVPPPAPVSKPKATLPWAKKK